MYQVPEYTKYVPQVMTSPAKEQPLHRDSSISVTLDEQINQVGTLPLHQPPMQLESYILPTRQSVQYPPIGRALHASVPTPVL